MKTTIIREPALPPIKEVVLSLTQEEAEKLRWLLEWQYTIAGSIARTNGSRRSSIELFISAMYNSIAGAGIERKEIA